MPSARFQPASLRASARKNKGMRAVVVYYRQFKIAVERCGHYPLPIHQTNKPRAFRFGPDSDQKSRKVAVALSVTIRVRADQWPDETRLSGLEDKFAGTVCGKRGADVS